MKEEFIEISIIDEKGEKIDSITIDGKPYGYFMKKGKRKVSSIREPKGGIVQDYYVLTFNEIEPVFSYLGYTQKEIAEVLEISPSTLSRWKKNDKEPLLGKLQSKLVLYIDEIICKGVRLFGSEEKFKVWLKTPNFALGDKKPVELLKDPYEVEKVDNAIEAMSWGSLI